MSFKRLFLRHYLSISALLLSASLSSLILAIYYTKDAWSYFAQSGILVGSSIDIVVIGEKVRKDDR